MATYAIGDLQGCFATLEALLCKIAFDRNRDRLWFVGDLVNRGPGSLECLRLVSGLGDRATVVLGNHDLHVLAVADGLRRAGRHDKLQPLLDAPDRAQLLGWLRQQKMLHVEDDFVMVHAGLMPQWDLPLAQELADGVVCALRGPEYRHLLQNMYGNTPDTWRDSLEGIDRYRITINAMTRMRVITQDNRLDLDFKGELANCPTNSMPWFTRRHPSLAQKTIVAGHWSGLGLHHSPGFFGIDSGCAWGNELTALRLDDLTIIQTPYAESAAPAHWD